MAFKRRREQHTDDEAYSEASGSGYDAPVKKTKQPVKKKTKSTPKQAKKKSKAEDAPMECEDARDIPHDKNLHRISSADTLCDDLLTWFTGVNETRGMPWRKTYDSTLSKDERAQRAYEVWVSEMMLQQTQVATVIPYYNRWMAKFPTIRDLGAATIDEVNAIWAGLGYYQRASRLLAGAQKSVKSNNGRLPDNAKDMESDIPGIGRYTAGAICSIAYGERVPVLDGNVMRLLSRVLALHAKPKGKATLDILWEAAETIVKVKPSPDGNKETIVGKRHAGDINEALIELGSTVCKVKNPGCADCPIQTHCMAYQREVQTPAASEPDIEDLCTLCEPLVEVGVTAYPMKAERKAPRTELDIVTIVEWTASKDSTDRFFLLLRRPDTGLLAGLFDFLSEADVDEKLTVKACLDKSMQMVKGYIEGPFQKTADPSLSRFFGSQSEGNNDEKLEDMLTVQHVKPVGDVLHLFSHIRKTYRAQWVKLSGGGTEPPAIKNKGKGAAECVWRPYSEVERSNISTGTGKVWQLACKMWG
ncbi:DNA glycosylase, partial [Cylindrobasidium torrendii FP15055 ss-10]